MLTRTQRDTFAADGYLVLHQLCDEAVLDPVRQLITRYVDEQIRAMHQKGQIRSLYAEAPFVERWALAARDYNQDPENPPLVRNWGQRGPAQPRCVPIIDLSSADRSGRGPPRP